MLYADFKKYIAAYNRRDTKAMATVWHPNVTSNGEPAGSLKVAQDIEAFWDKFGDSEIDLEDFVFQAADETSGQDGQLFYAFTLWSLYNKAPAEQANGPKLNDLEKTLIWVRYAFVAGKVVSMVGYSVSTENLGQHKEIPGSAARDRGQ